MLRFKRVHNTGTQTILSESADGWRINIDLREANHNAMTIVGYLLPTFEKAKQRALQVLDGLAGADTVQIVAYSDTTAVLNNLQTDRSALRSGRLWSRQCCLPWATRGRVNCC